MKNKKAFVLACILILSLAFPLTAYAVNGEKIYNNLICYKNVSDGIAITGLTSLSYSGDLVLPDMIDGKYVVEIADEAFRSYYEFNSITFPTMLKRIGNNAFSNAKCASGISLPSNVVSIGEKAFYNMTCSGTVSIPASVTSMGTYAFSYMQKVTAFNVNKNNTMLCSEEGVLFSKDQTTLWNYPLGKTDKVYEVPDKTTLLYCTSFGNAKNLKAIVVPNAKTRGMGYTFYGCTLEAYAPKDTALGTCGGNVTFKNIADYNPDEYKPIVLTGWWKVGDIWYYYDKEGTLVHGWINDNGVWRYLNQGQALFGIHFIDGYYRYFADGSVVLAPGFYELEGVWRCILEGGIVCPPGVHFIDGYYRYIGDGGTLMPPGWYFIEGAWRYFAEGSIALYGWHYVDGAYRYFGDGSVALYGWHEIDGQLSWFEGGIRMETAA